MKNVPWALAGMRVQQTVRTLTDASAFLLASNGKVRGDSDFIFYNNLTSSDGSVTHTGDNRTGEGDGDDESLKIKLTPSRLKLTRSSSL